MYKVVNDTVAELILNGSIRIGSALYYRDMEDVVRADRGEGAKGIEITNSTDYMSLNVDQVNKLLGQSFAPFKSNTIGFKFKGKKGSKTTLRSEANILMFCVTQDKTVDKFGNRVFKLNNLNQFGLEVSEALAHEVAKGNIKLNSLLARIEYRFAPVNYSEKGAIPFNDENDSLPIVLDDFFTKTVDFSEEKEIRTVWYFLAENGAVLQPQAGFKFIDIKINDKTIFQENA